MKKVELKEEDLRKINAVLEYYKYKGWYIIPILKKIQDIYGWLPKELQHYIANRLNLAHSSVYSIVTFYPCFLSTPPVKYAFRVCMGHACHLQGAEKILNDLKEKLRVEVGSIREDGLFSLDAVRCQGKCSLAPLVIVNDHTYGNVDSEKILDILKNCCI